MTLPIVVIKAICWKGFYIEDMGDICYDMNMPKWRNGRRERLKIAYREV